MAKATGNEEPIFVSVGQLIGETLSAVKTAMTTTMITSLSPFFTLLVILLLIILGYKMMMATPIGQRDLMILALKLVIVWMVFFSTSFFTDYFDQAFIAIKDLFVSLIPVNGQPDEAYSTLDKIIREIVRATEKMSDGGWEYWLTQPTVKIAKIVIVVASWVVTAIAFLMIVCVDTLLSLFIVLGPLFFLALLFDATRSYFFAWLQAIVSLLIALLVILFLVFIFSSVLMGLIDDMVNVHIIKNVQNCDNCAGTQDIAVTSFSWPKLIGSIIWFVCSFFLLLAAPVIASMLSGGVGAPIGSVSRAVTRPVGDAVRKGYQLGKGASLAALGYAKENNVLNQNPINRSHKNNASNFSGKATGDIPQETSLPIGRSHEKNSQSYSQAIDNTSSSSNYENYKIKKQQIEENVSSNNQKEQKVSNDNLKTSKEDNKVSNDNLKTSKDDNKVSNDNLKTSKDDNRVSNDNLKTSKDDNRVSNDNLKTSKDDNRVSNDNLKTSKDDNRVSNNNLKTSKEDNKVSNDNLKTSKDDSRVSNDNLANNDSYNKRVTSNKKLNKNNLEKKDDA